MCQGGFGRVVGQRDKVKQRITHERLNILRTNPRSQLTDVCFFGFFYQAALDLMKLQPVCTFISLLVHPPLN